MAALTIWFILTGGTGYIEPLTVARAAMVCGLDGAVVGVTVNTPKNPTEVSWPDPKVVGKHCTQNIAAKLATLPDGEYEIATTEMGADVPFGAEPEVYIHIDPHTTDPWTKGGLLLRPTTLRIAVQPQ
jgi:hypothetical protein